MDNAGEREINIIILIHESISGSAHGIYPNNKMSALILGIVPYLLLSAGTIECTISAMALLIADPFRSIQPDIFTAAIRCYPIPHRYLDM